MGRIYYLSEDDALTPLEESGYDAEVILQRQLARHPDLLAGDQMNPSDPRRWLLIGREIGIPDSGDGGSRWSVDHVFLDQDAVPTLVEAKRKTDTRLRREVVGQVLDYVSHAVAHWTDEELQRAFVETCVKDGRDPDQELQAFIGDASVEDFWERTRTNLRAGRVRIVFVADELPGELRRIVEFLNEQTDPMEVLAVEVRRYEGKGMSALVPRVVGQTIEAQARKGTSRTARLWDETSFMAALADRHGARSAATAGTMIQWAKDRGLRLAFGKGAVTGSMYFMLDQDDVAYYTFAVLTTARLEIDFQYMIRAEQFGDERDRDALRQRFNAIPGVDIPPDGINRFPSVPIEPFENPAAIEAFLEIWDWYLQRIRG